MKAFVRVLYDAPADLKPDQITWSVIPPNPENPESYTHMEIYDWGEIIDAEFFYVEVPADLRGHLLADFAAEVSR